LRGGRGGGLSPIRERTRAKDGDRGLPACERGGAGGVPPAGEWLEAGVPGGRPACAGRSGGRAALAGPGGRCARRADRPARPEWSEDVPRRSKGRRHRVARGFSSGQAVSSVPGGPPGRGCPAALPGAGPVRVRGPLVPGQHGRRVRARARRQAQVLPVEAGPVGPGSRRRAEEPEMGASPGDAVSEGAEAGGWRFETRAIHAGQDPEPAFGAVNVPIYQTSTYVQEAVGKPKRFDYARGGNPTREALQ